MAPRAVTLTLSTALLWIAIVLFAELLLFEVVPLSRACERIGPLSQQRSASRRATAPPLLVMADSHMLGARRSWLDRAWVDWQLRRSVEGAVWRHAPALAIHLGDLVDEGAWLHRVIARGGSDSDSARSVWAATARRFRASSRTPLGSTPLLAAVGNHDAGEGEQLREDALARFERSFSSAKAQSLDVFRVGGVMTAQRRDDGTLGLVVGRRNVTFVRVNALALAPHAPASVRGAAWEWLATAAATARRSRNPVVLLTHLPLYRASDEECGPLRAVEHDGVAVRWRASRALGVDVTVPLPSETLRSGVDVLDQDSTARLLEFFHPAAVLSGHTHAVCYTEHVHDVDRDRDRARRAAAGAEAGAEAEAEAAAGVGAHAPACVRKMNVATGELSSCPPPTSIMGGPSASASASTVRVPEFTIPAFGWRMRPDASYAIMRLFVASSDEEEGAASVEIELCGLPQEHSVLLCLLVLIAGTCCAVVVAAAARDASWGRKRPPPLRRGEKRI